MKRLLSLLTLCLLMGSLSAQTTSLDQRAIQEILNQQEELGLTAKDVADLRPGESYASRTGAEHVIIQQYYADLPVYNGQAELHFRNGELFHQTSNLATGFEAQNPATTPAISAETALMAAAEHLGLMPMTGPQRSGGNASATEYSWPEVASTPITVRLNFVAANDGRIHLAWRLDLNQQGVADHWDLQLGAEVGRLLSQYNYTVYCDFNHADGEAKTGDCHLHYNHPSSISSLEMMSTSSLVDGSKYLVYPFGLESPLDGPQQLLEEPADPTASPQGWHTTANANGSGGANYTYTRGNNVYAYDDSANDNVPSVAEAVDGGAELEFNFMVASDSTRRAKRCCRHSVVLHEQHDARL